MEPTDKPDTLVLLQFPCVYPMKIFINNKGQDAAELRAYWWNFLTQHGIAAVENSGIEIQPSKNHRFLALRFNLWITSREQIESFIEIVKKQEDVVFIL